MKNVSHVRFPVLLIIVFALCIGSGGWVLQDPHSYPDITGERRNSKNGIEGRIQPTFGFERNQGQIEDEEVLFSAVSGDISYRFMARGYLIRIPDGSDAVRIIGLSFEGAEDVDPLGEGLLDHRSNYFHGNDPNAWVTAVEHVSSLRYANLYPGIDCTFTLTPMGLKYDLILQPGADPDDVRIMYEGADSLNTSSEGNLKVRVGKTELIEERPVAYQTVVDHRVSVECEFATEGNVVSFVAGGYDPDLPLVIDPLVFSTYVGGDSDEKARDITMDDDRNIYVTGYTESENFPTTAGSYSTSKTGVNDIFVFKMDPEGKDLIYSTFIGGSGRNMGEGITLDNLKNAFILGLTFSPDFPTTNEAYDRTYNGYSDLVVCKLNDDGSELLYSTYIGGSGYDYSSAIALNDENNAVLLGNTRSSDYPTTTGAYDTTHNGEVDILCTTLNAAGSDLVSSTFLGGGNEDWGRDMVLGPDDEYLITGGTDSPDFPTTDGAYDTEKSGGDDVIICSMLSDGSDLEYSTFVGGADGESGQGLIRGQGNVVYVTGDVRSEDFPVTNGSFDESYNDSPDAFILEFDMSGSELLYATFFGGTSIDQGWDITLDGLGNPVLTGFTESEDFPVTNGSYSQSFSGIRDVFVCRVDIDHDRLLYGTYIGGSGYEFGNALVIAGSDEVIICGESFSQDYPTTEGSYDGSANGAVDVIITRVFLENEPGGGGGNGSGDGDSDDGIPGFGFVALLGGAVMIGLVKKWKRACSDRIRSSVYDKVY